MRRRFAPAVLAHLGRMACGVLWRLAGQRPPLLDGIYASPPYVTGPDSIRVTAVYPGIIGETRAEAARRYADLTARRRWPGFPPLPCSPGYMLGRAWE